MEQEPRRLELLDRNASVLRRSAEYAGWANERLSWQPPGGGWGVGTVFEHLCTAHAFYLPTISKLLSETPERDVEARPEWKASLAGGLLVRSMEAPMKMRAPGLFTPAPETRPDVVRAFIQQHEQVALFLAASCRMPWQRMRLASPVTWLIRMNLGDAFGVLVAHAERHLAQADRAAASMPPRHA
jgi:hypothetical protein